MRTITSSTNSLRLTVDELNSKLIEELFSSNPQSVIFSDPFLDVMRKAMERIENWQLAVIALSAPFYIYLITSLFQNDPELFIFGFRLHGIPEMRDCALLTIYLLGVPSGYLSAAMVRRRAIVRAIIRCKYNSVEMHIIAMSIPEGFYSEIPHVPNNIEYRQGVPPIAVWTTAITLGAGIFSLVAIALAVQTLIWISVIKSVQMGLNWRTFILISAAILGTHNILIGIFVKAKYVWRKQ